MITGTTKLLGVIGYPIEHSLSPVMHNAAIKQLNLDYVYLPLPIAPENLATALDGFRAIDLVGFSATIPHKQSLIPLLAEITPEAQAIGAVNTVWWNGTGWSGTNTDIIGFLSPLKKLARNWHNTTALIMGNGGAARAVVVACHQLGCDKIQVVGRSLPKLLEFQESWSSIPIKVEIYPWTELTELIGEADLIINTTPIGMSPNINDSPITEEMGQRIKSTAIAYDLIYNPKPTRFLTLANQSGATIIDGLEMLVQQGAAALEIWLGQPVPADIMAQSLLNYLKLD
jgi:shikimate dehydrogenase